MLFNARFNVYYVVGEIVKTTPIIVNCNCSMWVGVAQEYRV